MLRRVSASAKSDQSLRCSYTQNMVADVDSDQILANTNNTHNMIIEEFPIIGFYLYHVTPAGQSSNWTTSGIKQHILTVDLFL